MMCVGEAKTVFCSLSRVSHRGINVDYRLILRYKVVDLGGLVVSVLATGPKVRGFDTDRGRWIFKGEKNPEHNFLRRGSKAVGPMS
jgi:hypothetical protein